MQLADILRKAVDQDYTDTGDHQILAAVVQRESLCITIFPACTIRS